MSKLIQIWFKNTIPDNIKKDLVAICKNLEPDNLKAYPSKILIKTNKVVGISNPNPLIEISENGILFGKFFEDPIDWDIPLTKKKDGSYILIRDNELYGEVQTDISGTKALWYCLEDEYLAVSTSQRALVMYLKSFEFNPKVIPWMLSTGSLGYGHSWDSRIKYLQPNSFILLDKRNWEIEVRCNPIIYNSSKSPDDQLIFQLKNAIEETITNLNLDWKDWALPLSGGVDSRGLLLYFAKKSHFKGEIKTFTYGPEGSGEIIGNDAYVANKLTSSLNVKNVFYSTHSLTNNIPIETICDRYLHLGEGRIDNIKGYLDGFDLWKSLFEKGVKGIIRGDVIFGFPLEVKLSSDSEVRDFSFFKLCSEYKNLKHLTIDNSYFPEQKIPKDLKKLENESLLTYVDRLYATFRIPTMMSALTDLKLPYVDVINPLLSGKIADVVRILPDHLRFRKLVWKNLVESFGYNIPYSTNSNYKKFQSDINRNNSFLKFQYDYVVKSENTPEYLKDLIQKEWIKSSKSKSSKLKMVMKFTAANLFSKNLIYRFKKLNFLGGRNETLDIEKLVTRIFILARMNEILKKDAELLEQNSMKTNKS